MKGFFWYPAVGILVIIPNIISLHFFKNLNFLAFISGNISLIFHFCFLGIFIIKTITNKLIHIFLKTFFVIFLCLIIFLLVIKDIKENNRTAFAFANFGLIFFCIIYYHQLFNNIPILNLKQEPSFWIITGIFFCMSIHIPILITTDYLRYQISISNYRLLLSCPLFSYTIMHLFFIKACLCAIHPQRV